MTKKIRLIVIFMMLVITLCSCGLQSGYNSLTEHQKGIVNSVLSNSEKFSDCNNVKFGNYNGKTYFIASYTEYSYSGVGVVKEQNYYIVTPDSFYSVSPDTYSSQTWHGGVYDWDDNWDDETKKEKLPAIIKDIV